MTQAHIIFLLSDQHNADIMAWRGDPAVRTPNLDRLAAEGTALTNCYCGSPLCVPSRSSMLTTLLPHRTGVFTNKQCLASDRITFAHQLGNAGYCTVLTGRMHFKGPDQWHGYHERLVGDIGDTNWSGRGPGTGNGIFRKYGTGPTALSEAGPGESRVLAYDRAVIDKACERLDAHAGQAQPLFMTIGLYGPHNPYACRPELFTYYKNQLDIPRPVDVPESTHPAVKAYYKQFNMGSPDPSDMHNALAAYYGMIETLDAHVGRIRQKAQQVLGDNVLFVYGSDHGDMAGSHGTFGKQCFFEGAARVPLMFAGPGVLHNHRIEQPTSLMDLGCTLLHAGSASAMPETDGISLWNPLQGKGSLDTDRPIIAQLAQAKPGALPAAMIRQGPFKLIAHGFNDARPQLFDLSKDPKEFCDRGLNPTQEDQQHINYFLTILAQHWNPRAADRTAKLANSHAMQLWRFEHHHPTLPIPGWNAHVEEWREAPDACKHASTSQIKARLRPNPTTGK